EKVLPLSLAGRDVAGEGPTGTRKNPPLPVTLFTPPLQRARGGGPPPAPRAGRPPPPRAAGGRDRAPPPAGAGAPPLTPPGRHGGVGQKEAGGQGEGGRGPPRGSPRSLDRLPPPARPRPARRGDPRHRRGRPHVRHGLHQGPALPAAAAPAVRPPPVDALLGHA